MVGRVGKVLEDEVDHVGNALRDRLAELHSAVHHDAAIPEVEDFQVLKVVEVRLEVRNQLKGKEKNELEMGRQQGSFGHDLVG